MIIILYYTIIYAGAVCAYVHVHAYVYAGGCTHACTRDTHVSEAWGIVSWLDHIVSSSDFHNCIKTVSIDHDLSDADHIPVRMDISLDDIPGTSSCDEGSYRRLCWEKLNADGRAKYRDVSHELLNQLIVPNAVYCTNVNCTDPYHITDTDSFYNEIMQCVIQASDTAFSKHNPIKGSVKPGWSDYAAELYSTSRDVAKLWGNAGKPRQGAKTINVFRACLGAQLTICAQK